MRPGRVQRRPGYEGTKPSGVDTARLLRTWTPRPYRVPARKRSPGKTDAVRRLKGRCDTLLSGLSGQRGCRQPAKRLRSGRGKLPGLPGGR
jgi:hypothetical protein